MFRVRFGPSGSRLASARDHVAGAFRNWGELASMGLSAKIQIARAKWRKLPNAESNRARHGRSGASGDNARQPATAAPVIEIANATTEKREKTAAQEK